MLRALKPHVPLNHASIKFLSFPISVICISVQPCNGYLLFLFFIVCVVLLGVFFIFLYFLFCWFGVFFLGFFCLIVFFWRDGIVVICICRSVPLTLSCMCFICIFFPPESLRSCPSLFMRACMHLYRFIRLNLSSIFRFFLIHTRTSTCTQVYFKLV